MVIKSDKLKISASAVKTYIQCPRKYYFTYINKLPKKKWPHIELGNFVHNVLESFHNTLKDLPKDQSEWGVLLKTICKTEISNHVLTKEQRATATGMLGTYLGKLREGGLPRVLFNEKEFSIDLPENILLRGFIDRVDEEDDGMALIDYKGLAVDTPIPTPAGWTSMGELKVGDYVFGSDGSPTRVNVKSKIHNRPCYKITLSDNSTVVCDNVHLWSIGYTERGYNKNYRSTLSADELFSRFCISKQYNRGSFFIQNPKPLTLPEINLPINPWVLGAWLGDGVSNTGALTIGEHDFHEITHIVKTLWGNYSFYIDKKRRINNKKVFTVTLSEPSKNMFGYRHAAEKIHESKHSGQTYCCGCEFVNNQTRLHGTSEQERSNAPLHTLLEASNLLHNKHIPDIYMRSSYIQRLDLLRGLMDTGGHYNKKVGRCVFVTTSDALAKSVAELIRTFGVTPQIYKRIDNKGHVSYRIEFRPVGFIPFLLPRKANKVIERLSDKKVKNEIFATRKSIKNIEKVASTPTQCISVDAADSLYVCGSNFTLSHNTGKSKYLDEFQLLVYAFALWHVYPDLKRVRGSYIVLGEGSKVIPYSITKTDVGRCITEITKVAGMIRSDQSWEPRPTRLCSYCDFHDACPATQSAKDNEWGSTAEVIV